MRARDVTTRVLGMHRGADPLVIPRIARDVRAGGYAMVHTHLFHADLYGTLAARAAGVTPIVSTKHGFNPWRSRRLYATLDRTAARLQSRIITISDAIGRWLVATEGLPAAKMQTIHYGLDGSELQRGLAAVPMRGEGRGLGTPVVGTVTRLLEQKGVHVLIAAFAACVRRHPTASLVIAGDGPARADLERLAGECGVGDRVHFLGYVGHPQVLRWIESFDIFAFPSFGEGFGLAILEAMLLGKPVVASDVMAIPEIAGDDTTGVLVPPGDVRALAGAIDALLSDPARRRDLGSAGRRRAELRFTVERMVHQTVEVYDAAVGCARAPVLPDRDDAVAFG